MRARDLAADFPVVRMDTDALDAARLLAEQDLPGLVVVDERGAPFTILPGTQVLRFAIPTYVQDDPRLAAVVDEVSADAICRALAGVPVRDLLPARPRELPVVDGSDTVLEIAAVIARTGVPLVAVVEHQQMLGVITLDALMDRIVTA
jgi:predicted transcriptional regulator